MSVSKLVYPERNPAGYLWALAGIVMCGTCALCWTAVLVHRWNHKRRGLFGVRTLQVGYFCMLCAVLPWWLLGIEKAHEILAALAFAGLLIGTVQLMYRTSQRILLKRLYRNRSLAKVSAIALAGVVVLPIVLAGLAQAYFYYVPEQFRWEGFSRYAVRGWPVLLRFPFWEWITCIVLSVYTVCLSFAIHADSRTQARL